MGVFIDRKLREGLKVVSVDDLHVYLATCPGSNCVCINCVEARARAEMAAKAPLGQRVAEGASYTAVILAGHTKIRVLGLFPQSAMTQALAYVKANYKCEPLGKTRFRTKDGEILILQEHVHILSLEAT